MLGLGVSKLRKKLRQNIAIATVLTIRTDCSLQDICVNSGMPKSLSLKGISSTCSRSCCCALKHAAHRYVHGKRKEHLYMRIRKNSLRHIAERVSCDDLAHKNREYKAENGMYQFFI